MPTDIEDFVEDPLGGPLPSDELRSALRSTASGRHHFLWEERLREGFKRERGTSKRPSVRLPSPDERRDSSGKIAPALRVYGDYDAAHIVLNSAAVSANMQTNAAAFEGWALALRRWAGAHTVSLAWPEPDTPDPHLERLIYRAARFSELFPWFEVKSDISRGRALDTGSAMRRLLNTPSKRAGVKAAALAAATPHREWADERAMECSLRHSDAFAAHFRFAAHRRDQQFPVGLFGSNQRRARREDRIFPGGKGAIDLVCAEGSRFWLFELKARDNIPLGALSELLFYTSVLRDVRRGHFDFAEGTWADCDVFADDVRTAEEFVAVLLGDKIHPLLDDPRLWRELNEAVEANWNSLGGPRVTFRATKTTEQGFRDIYPCQ